MTKQTDKTLAIKFVGTDRSPEQILITPDTTVRQILEAFNLTAIYDLCDPANPDVDFRHPDTLFDRVSGGDCLAVAAMMDVNPRPFD